MYLLFYILLTLLVYFIIRRRKRYNEFWKYLEEIPHPHSVPIFGTNYKLHTSESLFIHDRLRNKQLYPIYKLWMINFSMVCILSPEDIELVLSNTKHNDKSVIYSFMHDWLGTGLLTSGGTKWHTRRKILTPAFHFSILQEFVEILNNESNILVENLKKISDAPFVDVLKPITEFTLYSIGETSLGVPLREDANCKKYKQAIYDFGENLTHRAVRPWLFPNLTYRLSSLYKRNKKLIKTLHNFSTNVINEKKKSYVVDDSYSKRKKLALLDLMLKAKYNGADIDDEGIREELDTFIFEGHDTTSLSICYTLMALANEPSIQEKIYQELVSVVGESKVPSYQELGDLKFLERCIKESLRLYPSVPFIARKTGKEINTKTGYTIPNNCDVNIYIYDLHRRPEFWENPDKFDPDRFLPENIAKRHPFSYIPFSAGSRNCIGQKFAILELKAVLSAILGNFILEPVTKPEDIIYKADIVLRPSCEIRIKFTPRITICSCVLINTIEMYVLFAILLSLMVFYYIRRKRYNEFWKHILAIPGPKTVPILGARYKLHTAESFFLEDRQISNEFYPIYGSWTLNFAIVGLINPEDIELVVTNSKHNTKSIVYKFVHDWLGSGLITSEGSKWHKRRKILTPAFHFKILQEFVHILNKEANHLVEHLLTMRDQPYIDVVKPITEFALNAIGETSLGISLRKDPSCMEYKKAVYTYCENFAYRSIRPWLFIPFIYKLSPLYRANSKALKILHNFSDNIVQKKKEYFASNTSHDRSDAIKKNKLALLDLMFEARYNGADIDDEGIKEESDTFIFAGHDTTSVSLGYALMTLANEPKYQEEIYQEILTVIGESRMPTYQELSELKFMERCIKEILRLYPSVPVIGRIAGETINTKTGYTIPKGTFIHMFIFDMHRRPEIWENPEKFDPDRFLPENIAKRHPYSYIPFSAGNRNCIGQKFALLEIKIALCGILRKFKLEAVTKPEDVVFKTDIVLRSSCEINVKLVPRV